MVTLVVTAGRDAPDAEPIVAVLGGVASGEVSRTTDADIDQVLTDDLLHTLTAVVVVTGAEAEPGHRVCRGVRAASDSLPLGLVCPSAREVDELMAFANGCDEYIRLPCSPEVLGARLKALVAWAREHSERVVAFGCLQVDTRLRTASVRGHQVELTRTEFELMEMLLANQRRVVSRHELLDTVWAGCQTSEHVLDVHMSRLRAKILAAGGPRLGDPVPGVGYRVSHVTCSSGINRPGGAA